MGTALPLSSTTVATQTARQTKSMAGYGLLLCDTSLPARNFPTITTCTTGTTMHPAAAAPRTVAAASIRRKNSPNAPRELLPRPDYQRLTDLHSSHERGATARASGKQVRCCQKKHKEGWRGRQKEKEMIAHLPKSTRMALGKEGAPKPLDLSSQEHNLQIVARCDPPVRAASLRLHLLHFQRNHVSFCISRNAVVHRDILVAPVTGKLVRSNQNHFAAVPNVHFPG